MARVRFDRGNDAVLVEKLTIVALARLEDTQFVNG